MRILLVSILLFIFIQPAKPTQVWFAPADNLGRGVNHDIYFNHDFQDLFDENPAWHARVDVFVISPLLGSPAGPDDELIHINDFLKKRHIDLAVGVDATLTDSKTPLPGECGVGVEGGSRPGTNAIYFKRLKALGLDIKYIALDEPLTFGHYYNKGTSCKYSIFDTARRVGAAVSEIKRYYPMVRVVDFEALPELSPKQWLADFAEWMQDYKRTTSEAFDSVVFDVNLLRPWSNRISRGVDLVHRNGSRAGIFITKLGPSSSDADAVDGYKRGIQSIDAAHLVFDLVVIANWTLHPSRNLPEADPNTLTGVLDWYNNKH